MAALTQSLSRDKHTYTHTHEESIRGPQQSVIFPLYPDSNLLRPIIKVKGCLFVLRVAVMLAHRGRELSYIKEGLTVVRAIILPFFPHNELESLEYSLANPQAYPLFVPLCSSLLQRSTNGFTLSQC